MSNQITTAFVEQYSSNIQMLSQQKGSLLRDVKALASGDVNSFLGFNFVVSNRLSVGSSIRDCIAFVNDGIALAVGKDVTARIDERADKGYATQVYYSAAFGATRMEEEKVVKIQAYEG
jgi:hypothetical protein